MDRTIAHLSDVHLDAREAPLRRFRQVLAAVRALPSLDALVVSGDIANNGLDGEYAAFRAELDPAVPTLVVPGNHDIREGFERALGPRNSRLDHDGLTLIGLDSSIPGEDPGLLDAETLAFAEAAVAATTQPTLIVLHHPPVEIGHPPIDRTRLQNPDALAKIVARGRVLGTLTGHVHTTHTTQFAGVPLLGAPAIVSTLNHDVQDRISADGAAPPGFAVHTLSNGRLRTRFVALAP